MCTLTYIHMHTQIKTASLINNPSERASFYNLTITIISKVYLYSYHLATLTFSWKFSFDKLFKLYSTFNSVYMVQNTCDIIAIYIA